MNQLILTAVISVESPNGASQLSSTVPWHQDAPMGLEHKKKQIDESPSPKIANRHQSVTHNLHVKVIYNLSFCVKGF